MTPRPDAALRAAVARDRRRLGRPRQVGLLVRARRGQGRSPPTGAPRRPQRRRAARAARAPRRSPSCPRRRSSSSSASRRTRSSRRSTSRSRPGRRRSSRSQPGSASSARRAPSASGRSSRGSALPAPCSSGRTASASSTPPPSSTWRRTRCRRARSASSRRAGTSRSRPAFCSSDLGLGFSRLVSVGNQADLDVTEVVANLAAHDGTRVIGVYCEDFRDGRAFAETARTAGKPVVLLTVGRTAAAVRAARSHTGSLTSDLDAVDAACRAAGVHRVDTPRQLVDAVAGAARGGAAARPARRGRRRRRRLRRGRERPARPARPRAARALRGDPGDPARRSLPPTAATANPVDLAGAGEQDTFSFVRATRTLLEADELDAVLFTAYFGGYSALSDELRERELAVAGELARGGEGDRTAARRAHDVLGLAAGPRAPRGGHPGLPGGRVGGRGTRRARGRRRRPSRPHPGAPARRSARRRGRLLGGAGGARGGRRAVRRGARRSTTGATRSRPPPSSAIPSS